jgi:O-antigen/teichoic acid export membrane protein
MTGTSIPISDRVPLKQRVFTASAWSLGGYGVGMVIRFGSNLVMTRLLVPQMFGVMAIASVVMVGLALFSDLGLRQNIVQSRRGSDPAFLNTAWAVQILRGLVLWTCALFVSLVIFLAGRFGLVPPDSVYANPSLPYVIAALSFGAVISGFTSTKVFEASRNLSLGRITQRDIAAQTTGLACMLAWASVDRSIWVLVAGSLAAGTFQVVFSHLWLPGTKNIWHWDRGAATEIFHFGKWIFASSILGFLVNNSDRLLLGWLVDSSVLGVYAIAFLMFNAIEQVLTRVIGAVAFPALSEVVRDRKDLKAAYYKFHRVIAPASYFCAGVLMTSGQTLVHVLYDPRYADAGWMLQILSASLLIAPFHLATQSYLALGRPQLHTRVLVLRLVALVVALPLGFFLYGTAGAIWGVVASLFLYLPILVFYNVRCGVFSLEKELVVLPAAFLGAAAGLSLTYLLG